jgi:hypothetical protein
MRLVALLLLLANVAFFAWAQYSPRAGSPEAHLVEQQIKPESIRLLTPLEVSKLARGPVAAAAPGACVEWGAFSAADIEKAQAALEQLAAPAKVVERRVEEPSGWWVFMPPQPTRPAALQKVEELKRLGVADYFVVQDDPKLRFAISLGIFRTEEAARARLEQLRGQGVKTALVGRRQTPVQRVYLQVKDVPQAAQARLVELKEAFPAAELKECES